MLEPWQWVLVALGALLVGISKTGIAGLGILPVAIYASVFSARESVGVLLLVLIAADIVAAALYRHEASWPHLWQLFPAAGLGVVLGTLTMGRIDDLTVRRMIGAILTGLVLLVVLRRRFARTAQSQPPANIWLARLVGLGGGFTTLIANAAGPLMTIYLLSVRLPKMTFIGTAAWFFLVLNLFKVPFNIALGLVNWQSLQISAILAPLAIIGALLGRRLVAHIDQHLFENLALIFTFLAGIRLLS